MAASGPGRIARALAGATRGRRWRGVAGGILGTPRWLSASSSSSSSSSPSPLAYEMIEPPAGTPNASDAPIALVLHGLMGAGRNLRTFTRALSSSLAERRAPFRFALVDHVW